MSEAQLNPLNPWEAYVAARPGVRVHELATEMGLSAIEVRRIRWRLKKRIAQPPSVVDAQLRYLPKRLRHLTVKQREAYRLYRRKGFSADESLAAVEAS